MQLFSHRSHVQMRRIAVHYSRAKFSLDLNTSNIIQSVIPIVLSYEAITTASWEGCNVNVCTSSTPSNDSFVKSTGTSVGGLTWLGRKPTRDDPRCNRVLDPPVYERTTRKDYGLGVHCKPAKDNPRYNRALEPLVYKYTIEKDYGIEVGGLGGGHQGKTREE